MIYHPVLTRNIGGENKLVSFVEFEILYLPVYKWDLLLRRNERENLFTFSPVYYVLNLQIENRIELLFLKEKFCKTQTVIFCT